MCIIQEYQTKKCGFTKALKDLKLKRGVYGKTLFHT